MPTSRRHFLGSTLAAGTIAANASPQSAQQIRGARSANDKIQIGLIGAGGMGMGDAGFSIANGAAIVAVADVYDGRLERSREMWGRSLFAARDYREVLARPGVDAVIVATPDHWHHQIAIDAMNAGKDVYLEKPMVQRLEDGPAVIETAHKTGRILQVGSQRVSSVVYQKAKELLERGVIGEVNLIEAWWDRNSAIGAWQYSIPPDASAQTIDWDRFLGRAPKTPFAAERLFRWRNYRDYGTGVAGDLFVHLFSGMHFVMGAEGPTRVFATGGLRFWKDGRDVPDVLLGIYDYPAAAKRPAFNLALRVDFVNGAAENSGFRFVGREGVVSIDGGVSVSRRPPDTEPGYTVGTFPRTMQETIVREYREKYPPAAPSAAAMRAQSEERYLAPRGYNDHLEHHRVFLEAIRTRKPVLEDAAFGFRAAGPALLSNLSYFEQRACEWDPIAMRLRT